MLSKHYIFYDFAASPLATWARKQSKNYSNSIDTRIAENATAFGKCEYAGLGKKLYLAICYMRNHQLTVERVEIILHPESVTHHFQEAHD